jgi:hypothetical protein
MRAGLWAWLSRLVVRLYPPGLRERYGQEVEGLLRRSTSARDLADVAWCATLERAGGITFAGVRRWMLRMLALTALVPVACVTRSAAGEIPGVGRTALEPAAEMAGPAGAACAGAGANASASIPRATPMVLAKPCQRQVYSCTPPPSRPWSFVYIGPSGSSLHRSTACPQRAGRSAVCLEGRTASSNVDQAAAP